MQRGLFYTDGFLKPPDRHTLVHYLESLSPIWESKLNYGKRQELKRPVYWLGNWQFATLGYYHPPHKIHERAIQAEPFPHFLKTIVERIETKVKEITRPHEVPSGWCLNTCLINYYGNRSVDGKVNDLARVGEHRDYEPGPVASFSLGERALFQFVSSGSRFDRSRVVYPMWLKDNSLQIFSGPYWKDTLFHRVQRVEKKGGFNFQVKIDGFQTRRINLTFRFVPKAHWTMISKLPSQKREAIQGYLKLLAQESVYYADAMGLLRASPSQ